MSLLKSPTHPGEVLKELYLTPLGMSAMALARRLELPRTRIERLVKGATGMTPDTALRLARFFGTTPQYWMAMQVNFDMSQAERRTDVSTISPFEPA